MTQTLTIQLSETTYDHLQRAAELAHQPLEVIVEQSLLQSLPPLLEEIPTIYQANVYPLLQMSAAELIGEMQRYFLPEHWAEYEALLVKKKEDSLTSSEQNRLNALRSEADILTFRKSYAAVLLKRRGYALPAFNHLPQAV